MKDKLDELYERAYERGKVVGRLEAQLEEIRRLGVQVPVGDESPRNSTSGIKTKTPKENTNEIA